MKGMELSETSITCSGSMGCQKDGHPVPLSYLCSARAGMQRAE